MTANEHNLTLQVGGAVNPYTRVYIVRASDDELLQLLARGEYANVLCSRQMGKSSLLIRTKSRLAEKGYAVAAIDVAGSLGSMNDASDWYQGLLNEIARQLNLSIDVKAWWNSSQAITPNQRLMQFFRDEVAAQIVEPVVIFLDEIDSTFRLPYTDDFFVAIRSMYNERPGEPLYDRVTFCLVGVASPNELIKDPGTTPYNIGRTIELEDFEPGRDNLDALFRAMSPNPATGETIVKSVLKWTGGHPYLTVSLCDRLLTSGDTSKKALGTLIKQQFSNLDQLHADIHFQAVLRFLEERGEDKVAALEVYRRIHTERKMRAHATIAHLALRLSGLVKRDDSGYLKIRNDIYSRVFSVEWVTKILERDVSSFEKILGPDVSIFSKFLYSRAPDQESTNEEYFRLRSKLIKFFLWRHCGAADDLADETLARVLDRLENGEVISDLTRYCYSVASGVLNEYLRERRKMVQTVELEDILSVQVPLDEDVSDDESRYQCLDRCLQELSPEYRNLILLYYQQGKSPKIARSKKLAEELGIPVNALRVRVFRIREKLQSCVRRCMEQKAQQ